MTKIIIPTSRPRMSYAEIANLPPFIRLSQEFPDAIKSPVLLIGIRGYYANTFGAVGRNDIACYDDALFVKASLSSGDFFQSYNFNTDPSLTRFRIATLACGVWWYRKHMHRGRYAALGQARPVTVNRYQASGETGYFGINIHSGGWRDTNSLGCQTLPPDQWHGFQTNVYRAMDNRRLKEIPYVLFDSPATIET